MKSQFFSALGIALRYVLDALRKPIDNKMHYLFGIAALGRFKNKLKDYPQYCGHIAAIPHFKQFPANLIEVSVLLGHDLYVQACHLSNYSTSSVVECGSLTTSFDQL